MKKYIFIVLSLVFLLALISCAKGSDSPIEAVIETYPTWKTDADSNGSSMRWEFSGELMTFYNVIDGEDTFSQNFNHFAKGNMLTIKNDYATLTYEVSIEGNVFTLKAENGNTLIFKGEK